MSCATMNNATNLSPQPTPANTGLPTKNYSFPDIHPTTMNYTQAAGSQKRGRGDDTQSSTEAVAPGVVLALQTNVKAAPSVPSVTPKKQRPVTYRAPREVKPSILSAVGSLVGGTERGSNLAGSVPLRRQLSGGLAEDFIGGDHNMNIDTDASDSRPRSMSF